MAKTYRVTPIVRLINRLMRVMIDFGVALKGTYMLTVKGRETGKLYSTPVLLIEDGSDRWLVSPYDEVNNPDSLIPGSPIPSLKLSEDSGKVV